MDDDAHQSEGFGAVELIDEGGNRLLAERPERRRKIDQVTGV